MAGNENVEDAVVEAAAQRAKGDSSGAWRLADAVLAAVPDQGNGITPGKWPTSSPLEGGASVQNVTGADKLEMLSERLAEAEVETPAGGAYTAGALRHLRETAMMWPPATRQPEAAFRTHQEAGSRKGDPASVLRALCLAARTGTDVGVPTVNEGEIDAEAWAAAAARVLAVAGKGNARYSVSANTVRIALRRKVNIPEPDEPVQIKGTEAMATPAQIGVSEADMTVEQDIERIEAKLETRQERGLDPVPTGNLDKAENAQAGHIQTMLAEVAFWAGEVEMGRAGSGAAVWFREMSGKFARLADKADGKGIADEVQEFLAGLR